MRLTEVFRQAAQSRIITSAHRINQGSIPDLSPPGTESDFYFVQADDPETAVGRIIELVKTRIPRRFGLDSNVGVGPISGGLHLLPGGDRTGWLRMQSPANLSGPTFPANREFKREILRNSALVATPPG